MNKCIESNITAAKVKLKSGIIGYRPTGLYYKRDLDIAKEINTHSVIEFIENYGANWENILRMSHCRITFQNSPL
jgi:hypothetical protein